MSGIERKYANAIRYIKQLEEAIECLEDKESPIRLKALKSSLLSQTYLSYEDLVEVVIKKEMKIRKLQSKMRLLKEIV